MSITTQFQKVRQYRGTCATVYGARVVLTERCRCSREDCLRLRVSVRNEYGTHRLGHVDPAHLVLVSVPLDKWGCEVVPSGEDEARRLVAAAGS